MPAGAATRGAASDLPHISDVVAWLIAQRRPGSRAAQPAKEVEPCALTNLEPEPGHEPSPSRGTFLFQFRACRLTVIGDSLFGIPVDRLSCPPRVASCCQSWIKLGPPRNSPMARPGSYFSRTRSRVEWDGIPPRSAPAVCGMSRGGRFQVFAVNCAISDAPCAGFFPAVPSLLARPLRRLLEDGSRASRRRRADCFESIQVLTGSSGCARSAPDAGRPGVSGDRWRCSEVCRWLRGRRG